MGLIDKARIELARNFPVPYEEQKGAITVSASSESGFDVSAIDTGSTYIVQFGEWSQAYASDSMALECFIGGLSGKCRLKLVLADGQPKQYIMEARIEDQWVPQSKVGGWVPFWKRKTFGYLQNNPRDYSAQKE